MAKKGKKSKKQEPAAPQLALTEWQKRNLEFQQKKREREVAQAQLQEAEREAKKLPTWVVNRRRMLLVSQRRRNRRLNAVPSPSRSRRNGALPGRRPCPSFCFQPLSLCSQLSWSVP